MSEVETIIVLRVMNWLTTLITKGGEHGCRLLMTTPDRLPAGGTGIFDDQATGLLDWEGDGGGGLGFA